MGKCSQDAADTYREGGLLMFGGQQLGLSEGGDRTGDGRVKEPAGFQRARMGL